MKGKEMPDTINCPYGGYGPIPSGHGCNLGNIQFRDDEYVCISPHGGPVIVCAYIDQLNREIEIRNLLIEINTRQT
jgi:hypothetical protein